MAIGRHLDRVAERLPAAPDDFRPSTDASDAVVLHLWQATQIVIDLAMGSCLALRLGTPRSYADAFRRLENGGIVDTALADRLVRAAGFRNLVAHGYESLDMARVHEAATSGPADLRQFLACLGDLRGADPGAGSPCSGGRSAGRQADGRNEEDVARVLPLPANSPVPADQAKGGDR